MRNSGKPRIRHGGETFNEFESSGAVTIEGNRRKEGVSDSSKIRGPEISEKVVKSGDGTMQVKLLYIGNQEAWAVAFDKLFPVACRVIRRLGLSKEDAEDVAQDAMIDIIEPDFLDKVKTFEDLENLSKAIAWRRGIDFLRRKNTEKRGSGRVDSLDTLLEEGKHGRIGCLAADDFRELVELAELMQFLFRVEEEELNGKERGILSDRFTLGMKLSEIAEKWNMAQGSVGVTLGRIINKVRIGLDKRGWRSLDEIDSGALSLSKTP